MSEHQHQTTLPIRKASGSSEDAIPTSNPSTVSTIIMSTTGIIYALCCNMRV